MAADQICIENLLVRGVIGLHAWERRTIQDILISVKLSVDIRPVAVTDAVQHGVNYSEISRRIMAHVEASQRFTIETLATDIAGLCVASPFVREVHVRVSKPSAERFAKAVAVEIDRTREMLLSSALVAIGSNTSPDANLHRAVNGLGAIGEVTGVSTVFESDPINRVGNPYLNAAVRIETCLPAAEVRRMLKKLESEIGRTREAAQSGQVPIDLDLCLLGSQIIHADDVWIPHPDLLTREYVATTCAQLLPEAKHPETGETLASLAAKLTGTMRLKTRPDVALA